MKTKTELLEMMVIELALIAIKSPEVTPGERQRINHILGDLQVCDRMLAPNWSHGETE